MKLIPTYPRRRDGLTLVEVLVATVITLIIAIALVQVFKVIGDEVTRGRATLELSGKLRTISHRLQADLDKINVSVRPWQESGYFEYSEGVGDPTAAPVRPFGVSVPHSSLGIANTITGDVDDYLAFTAYSEGEPFVGQVFDTATGTFRTITSRVAEIIWWISVDPNAPVTSLSRFTIHRRVLLVRPDLNDNLSGGTGLFRTFPRPADTDAVETGMADFLNQNDLSVRFETYTNSSGTQYGIAANSLEDLSRREYRFGRNGTQVVAALNTINQRAFPFYPNVIPYTAGSLLTTIQTDEQLGEDVMLKDVLAFDVKLFDPLASVYAYDSDTTIATNRLEVLAPGDPGYAWTSSLNTGSTSLTGPAVTGAFVDLHYGNNLLYNSVTIPPSLYSGPPHANSNLLPLGPAYDTWPVHYDRDGLDQGVDGRRDLAQNGIDDDGTNGIDDVGERETSPPYPFPLRGIQVQIRAIEPNSRIVRQMTVTADFVPE